MANSSVAVTEGSGKNLATYSISETSTKEISRIAINNSSGTEVTFNANGPAAPANSAPVVAAGYAYETVAASQTDQAMGATGATGDTLVGVLIVPATTGAGTVSIKDGGGSAINIFVTGTLSNLAPIYVPLNIRSGSGAWKLTTGANVSAIGIGIFT